MSDQIKRQNNANQTCTNSEGKVQTHPLHSTDAKNSNTLSKEMQVTQIMLTPQKYDQHKIETIKLTQEERTERLGETLNQKSFFDARRPKWESAMMQMWVC